MRRAIKVKALYARIFKNCNNGHKVEGPDLPRNGSAVIGCAPMERTSLNYTSAKCALEDTDDVVVHYRYYPDRTYKFVTELDPDHEVCDHWNPCQIGYIYSLPSPDQAMIANELWQYEQDSLEEWVPMTAKNYTSSPRRITIPEGYEFSGIKHTNSPHNTARQLVPVKYYSVQNTGHAVIITMTFSSWSRAHYGPYFCIFTKIDTELGPKREKVVKFLILSPTSTNLVPKVVELLPGQRVNSTKIPLECNRCRITGVIVRASDGNVYNMDRSKYRVDEQPLTSRVKMFELDIEGMKPQDFGDYIAVIQNGDGVEERIITATVLTPVINARRLMASFTVGGHFDRTMNYTCDNCKITDILCNGESVLAAGRVSVIDVSKMISFNFPRFEDENSCVYMGFFKVKNRVFKKILAVIDTVTIRRIVKRVAPNAGEQFEEIIPYKCDDCAVTKIFVNGIPVPSSRRSNGASGSFAIVTPESITIRIVDYAPTYEGVYQAVFAAGREYVTKTIMEITGDNHPELLLAKGKVAMPGKVGTTSDNEAAAKSSDAIPDLSSPLPTAPLPNGSEKDTGSISAGVKSSPPPT